MASQFLSNVAALLQPGGIFFGLLPDSSTLWYKQQRAIDAAKAAVGSGGAGATRPVIRSSLYSIVFENPTPFEDSKAVFDLRFAFKSADPSSLPAKSLLVHFPTLIRLAEAAGLRLIDIINLETLYNDTRRCVCWPTSVPPPCTSTPTLAATPLRHQQQQRVQVPPAAWRVT
ncbi:hypothetical protein CLOM_g8410 [Closterium sp. NIES-68]|nr:hypothetical protein CLOM_g8410 [Closterium sp. NIES-68]